MPFVLSTDTVPGVASFVDSSTLVGGSTSLALDKPQLGPTLGAGDTLILPPGGGTTVTYSFTAPEALTLRNLVFKVPRISFVESSARSTPSTFATSFNVLINRMAITGTGPNVGDVLTGTGICAGAFSERTVDFAPTLDITMDAGDVLEMDVVSIDSNPEAIAPVFTYDRGQDATAVATRLIGAAAGFLGGTVGGTNTAATVTITVNTAPLAAGDQLDFEVFALDGTVLPSLTGVAGARTPGDNDFDASLGSAAALSAEITAAINDSNNGFSSFVTATDQTGSVLITAAIAGSGGNAASVTPSTTPAGGLTASSTRLTGGTSPDVLAGPSPAAPFDITLSHVGFLTTLSDGLNPNTSYVPGVSLSSLEVNGTPVSGVGPGVAIPNAGLASIFQINQAISTGDTVGLNLRTEIFPLTIIAMLAGKPTS